MLTATPGATAHPFVAMRGVTRQWAGRGGVANISLAVPRGSFVSILGPSGCGKSTLLRLLAGLERPQAGEILINGRDVTHAPASTRGLSMVFQSYALFPHLSVAENIQFGLRVRRVPAADRARQLAEAIDMVGLGGLERRKPAELSGGQRQRVALARAVVSGHPLCLMDEPLSNLDAKLRHSERRDIKRLQRRLGLTLVYVTHDQSEAMSLSDRIILMRDGPNDTTKLILNYILGKCLCLFRRTCGRGDDGAGAAGSGGGGGAAIRAARPPDALPMSGPGRSIEAALAILLAIVWISPLVFAVWAALHSPTDAMRFTLAAPLTFDNFRTAWAGAPWLRYGLNSFLLVTSILIGQFILTTLADYAFAQVAFRGRDVVFVLVLMQLFILPEVLIVENYRIAVQLGPLDTILGNGAPYMASAFGIFLMRQAFKSVPLELDEAARVEGCALLGVLWRVYVPAARPTYLAYALVSVSTHWNNFLWPLIVTNTAATRPLPVGLSLFAAPENGVNISIISAATLIVVAPLLILFLLFQRQFVQAFLRAGIK